MKKSTTYYISILFTAIIIVAGLVYLFQAYNVWAYLNPGADPIHYWNMDEMDYNTCPSGGDVCDMTGVYNGTAYGSIGWVGEDECVAGGCMYFDGVDDYVNFGDIPSVEGDLSISFWIRPTDMTYRQNPLGKAYYDEFDFTLEIDDGLQYYHGETSSFYYGVTTDPEYYLSNNQWQHIVVTRDVSARTGVYYVNGAAIKTFNWDASRDPTAGGVNFQFGKTYIANEYKGYLDEVKIYNYQRNASQVAADYNAGIAGHTPKIGSGVALGSNNNADPGVPYAYWQMDDSAVPGIAYDSSGNGFTGIPANISWEPGKRGNAALFNSSSDKITLPYTWQVTDSTKPFGSKNSDMSISMWIYPTVDNATCSNHNICNIMFANAGTAIDDNFEMGWYQDTVNFYMELSGTDYEVFVSSNMIIRENAEWRYITLTKSSTAGVKVYVNGILQATYPTLTGTFNVNGVQGNDLMIGQTNNTGVYYSGYIDDLRIYDYAIEEKQILNDMYAAKGTHPILHYAFEENGNTAASDSTLSAFQGTINGSPNRSQDGVLGRGLYFDGSDDRIAISNWGYPASWSDYFSISTWINVPASETWTNGYKSAIMGRGDGAGSHGLIRQTTNNQVAMYVRGDNGEIYASGTITRDSWHHLVGIWDGTQVALYIDGVLESQTGTARTGSPAANTWYVNGPVTFGGNIGQYNEGGLDELKFYNYALSSDDIANDFNYGSAVVLGADKTSSSSWVDGGFGGDPLLAYWNFEEGSGSIAQDISSNGYLGTYVGSPQYSLGKIGWGLEFDGGDYINIADNLGDPTAITIELWFKKSNINAGSQYMMDARNGGTWWWLQDYVAGVCTDSNGNICFDARAEIPSSELSNNTWYHVAVTDDASAVKLYLDGRLIATGTGEDPGLGTNLRIGTRYTDANRFVGSMDEIKIFNYVRSQAQIAFDMNGGKPTAHWNFDENTGTSAYDRYGGYTGTLTGDGVTWVDGKFGYALNFAGSSDYINIEPLDTDFNIDGNANVTFAAWIYPTSLGATRGIIGITTSNRDYALQINSSNYLIYHFNDGSFYNCTDSTSTVSLNTWTHVAASMEDTGSSSTRVRLYKDGILVNTCDHAADPVGTSSVWVIGGLTTTVEEFIGSIDDVQFYNYALSDDQVKKAMFANSAVYLE
ncbi:MAG: LamG domain-containing protein [Candidatus Komeilibacteria bacterium]